MQQKYFLFLLTRNTNKYQDGKFYHEIEEFYSNFNDERTEMKHNDKTQ